MDSKQQETFSNVDKESLPEMERTYTELKKKYFVLNVFTWSATFALTLFIYFVVFPKISGPVRGVLSHLWSLIAFVLFLIFWISPFFISGVVIWFFVITPATKMETKLKELEKILERCKSGEGDKSKSTAVQNATALRMAPNEFVSACQRGEIDKIKNHLKAGGTPNIKNQYGETGLTLAAHEGKKDIVLFLLENGADINITDRYNTSALIWAINRNHKEIAELLIQKGADVNVKDNKGNTALLWAVANGYKDLVEPLIMRNAEVNVRANNGATPLSIANMNGYNEIADILNKHGAKS